MLSENRGYVHTRPSRKYINLDTLIFPVLFLHLSIIEFCLKIILTKINNHIDSGCEFFDENCKITFSKNHKLGKLFGILDKFYKDNSDLPSEHILKEMELLKHVVVQFDDHKIESVKVRYITDKNNELYEIYKKGLTCDFIALHEDIKRIVNNTINYISSFDLIFCSSGEYTLARYIELEKVYMLMRKLSDLTTKFRKANEKLKQNIREKKIQLGEYPDGFKASDVMLFPNDSDYYDLESFKDEELSLLVLGVYFNQYPHEPLQTSKYFDDWSREKKIRKVNQRVLNIDRGIANLKKHMQRIKKMIPPK